MADPVREARETVQHLFDKIPLQAYPYQNHPQDCPMWCCDNCHFMFSPAPCMMCGLTGDDVGISKNDHHQVS